MTPMKRKKNKQKLQHHEEKKTTAQAEQWLSRKTFVWIFTLILLSSIAYKIYKVDYTGISFDESYSFTDFGLRIDDALTKYPTPNNHVINSILIHFAYNAFKSYEHFVRIPSLTFGIMLSFSLAYITCKVIRANTLRLAVLAAVSFSAFVFDYSYLARGYAIALGAIFVGIAIICRFLTTKIRYANRWLPIFVLIGMNFIAFGSMLSTVFILAAVNLVFILLYSSNVFVNPPNRRNPLALNFICVPILSFIPIALLYRRLYHLIGEGIRTGTKPGKSFFPFLQTLMARDIIPHKHTPGMLIFWGFIVIITIALIFFLYRLSQNIKHPARLKNFDFNCPGNFILLITAAMLIFMFIYSIGFHKGMGYARNHVFLIPLVLLCAGVLLDRFCHNLKHDLAARLAMVYSVVILLLITCNHFPSPYCAGGKTLTKQLLYTLRSINPDKVWKIKLSRTMRNFNRGPRYYLPYGHKFRLIKHKSKEPADITLWAKGEEPENLVYLDRDFFDKLHCRVTVNTDLTGTKIFKDIHILQK
jgi:hypothetical protein